MGDAPGRTPIVFVCDASVEAVRVVDTLRGAGYAVTEVALGTLHARVQTERPHVVLVDADKDGALDEIVKVRRLPGSGAIDFVYFGSGEGDIQSTDDALAHEGSAFFLRPIDLAALIRRVEALTGGPAPSEVRRPTPPPGRPGSVPPDRSSGASLPGPGLRSPGPPLPLSAPSLVDLVDAPRSLASFGTVSSELSQLLADAELRAEVSSTPDALPSPEEEIESVLPADVLASLDEPLDADEDDEPAEGAARTGPGVVDGTGAHAKGTTAGGRQPTTGAGRTPHTQERRAPGSDAPQRTADSTADVRRSATPPFGNEPRAVSRAATPSVAPTVMPTSLLDPRSFSSLPPAAELRGPSVQPAPDAAQGVVLVRTGDARRFVADAIAQRRAGALCFDHDGVVRRIVLRDGDFVTAASGAERESLVHFLVARGELPRDELERLAAKVPPYGRHAGAALVAHGWLGQDQLWNVLRAHAEWIATAVLRMQIGIAQIEAEPPGRLRSEPSVFAATTGCEVFVELVRRAVAADEAIEQLGGEASRIGDGPNGALLAECNLSPQDLDLVGRARGGTVRDLLARAPDAEIASVLHALALLGIVDVVAAPDFARSRAAEPRDADPEVVLLDEEAVRARVRARLELVEEGDYFSILGVPRDATSYEIRRAFLELRRAFEPSRVLTPRVADLADDVRKIVNVLEEAYEILRDAARRERYRRAIEATP